MNNSHKNQTHLEVTYKKIYKDIVELSFEIDILKRDINKIDYQITYDQINRYLNLQSLYKEIADEYENLIDNCRFGSVKLDFKEVIDITKVVESKLEKIFESLSDKNKYYLSKVSENRVLSLSALKRRYDLTVKSAGWASTKAIYLVSLSQEIQYRAN